MKIQIKRIYDPLDDDDGLRVVVDRLWPRGVKKLTVTVLGGLFDSLRRTLRSAGFAATVHDIGVG